jgi:hypothetical protein
VNAALYYPYSRCLDETALKRAVLLYDELLFVDPVDPAARSNLYLREAQAAGVDPAVSKQWLAAQSAYDLLQQHQIVRTVDSTVLRDRADADALAAAGLALDIEINDSPSVLFDRRRRWQMLEARVPQSALDHKFRPRPGPRSWDGEPVVEVPYAVGASLALTYALAIAHELGVTPFTDQRAHDMLLRQRLRSASSSASDLGVYLPCTRRTCGVLSSLKSRARWRQPRNSTHSQCRRSSPTARPTSPPGSNSFG